MADQSKAVHRFLDALGDFERAGLALVEAWDDGEFNADEVAPLPAHLTPPMSLDEWLLGLSEHFVNALGSREPLDLLSVVQAIRGAGFEAVVEHTGGNTATLYAGTLDSESERYPVVAGPGWFDTGAYADLGELSIGADDEGATEGFVPPIDWTVEQVAAYIIGLLRDERLRDMAIEAAVRATAGLHEEFEEAEAEVMGEGLATMPPAEFERHAALYAATFTTYTQNLLREEAKVQWEARD